MSSLTTYLNYLGTHSNLNSIYKKNTKATFSYYALKIITLFRKINTNIIVMPTNYNTNTLR